MHQERLWQKAALSPCAPRPLQVDTKRWDQVKIYIYMQQPAEIRTFVPMEQVRIYIHIALEVVRIYIYK
eukprot:1638282-Amphidinium_carterae.1